MYDFSIGAYFSHPIRGEKGPAATFADMKFNNQVAIMVGKMIQNFCPNLKLYIPGEHDEYVTEAYLRKSQTEHEMLEIDKTILRRRDITIAFAFRGVVSNGMSMEIDDANDKGIPVFMFEKITEIPELVERIIDWYYNKTLS